MPAVGAARRRAEAGAFAPETKYLRSIRELFSGKKSR
jgi:hypothetical protein